MKNKNQVQNLLLNSAIEAGKLLRENAFTIDEIEWKDKTDPVTWLDRKAEEMIRERLLGWENMSIIGEEFEDYATSSPWKAYIDPLDGTKSYLRKEFNSTCCIALEYREKLHSAVVYDFMRDVMYVSIDGDPYIMMDGRKFGFGKSLPLKPRISVDSDAKKHLKKTNKERKGDLPFRELDLSGSYALHMINVANGTIEGLVSHQGKGSNYDIAASLCIVESLGLKPCNKDGSCFDLTKPYESFMLFRPELEKEMMPYFIIK